MQSTSIRLKIIPFVVAAIALASAAAFLVLNSSYQRTTDSLAWHAVDSASDTFAFLQRSNTARLEVAMDAVMANPAITEAFAAKDRDRLFQTAESLSRVLEGEHRITHWYFHNPESEGTNFLRMYDPGRHGDEITRATYLRAIETKRSAAGLELGKAEFALRVVRPYYDAGGELIGYLEMGQEIDSFLQEMKVQTGDDYGLLILKDRLNRETYSELRSRKGLEDNWDEHAELVLVDSTVDAPDDLSFDGAVADIPERGRVLGELKRDATTWIRGVVPVKNAAGEAVGAVVVLHDHSGAAADLVRARLVLAGTMLALVLLVSASLILFLRQTIFRRLDGMILDMEEISTRMLGGDYRVEGIVKPKSRDEIGEFEEFFGRFLTVVADALRRLSGNKQEGVGLADAPEKESGESEPVDLT